MALIEGLSEKAAAAVLDEDKLAAGGMAILNQAAALLTKLLTEHRLVITLERKEPK